MPELYDWERCPKRHATEAQHLLDCLTPSELAQPATLDTETLLAEWQALVGAGLTESLRWAVERVNAGEPYALTEALAVSQQRLALVVDRFNKLSEAFDKVVKQRNEFRARAKRAQP
jgi:hypothetical protein